MNDTDNMLSVLEGYMLVNPDDISKSLADDFRKRRIEKGLTREMVGSISGVPVSNITRFEQKGLISLQNLIRLAIPLGYISEVKHIFSTPKFSTMEELTQIRRNTGKKKAYNRRNYGKH